MGSRPRLREDRLFAGTTGGAWHVYFHSNDGCSAGMTVVQRSPFVGMTEVGDLGFVRHLECCGQSGIIARPDSRPFGG